MYIVECPGAGVSNFYIEWSHCNNKSITKFGLSVLYKLIRAFALYSMTDKSSDELKLSPTRKLTIHFFSFFFQRKEGFFTQSVAFLSENRHNNEKCLTSWLLKVFILFFSFGKAQTPLLLLLCAVLQFTGWLDLCLQGSPTIEYNANVLIILRLN